MRQTKLLGSIGAVFSLLITGTPEAQQLQTVGAQNVLGMGQEALGAPGSLRDRDRERRSAVAKNTTDEMRQAVTDAVKKVEARWSDIREEMARLHEDDARAMAKYDERQQWVRAIRIVAATANAVAVIGQTVQAARAHQAANLTDAAAEIVEAGRPIVALEVEGEDGTAYIVGIDLHGELEGELNPGAVEAHLEGALRDSQCGEGVCRSPAYLETGFDAAMLAISAKKAYEAFRPGSIATDSQRFLSAAALGVDVLAVALPGVPAIGGRSIMQVARVKSTVRDKFPKYFVGKFTDKFDNLYQSGVKWTDPKNEHNWVRIMFGNPSSLFPTSRHTYVRVQRHGKALDRYGRPLQSPTAPAAHIPLKEFLEDFPRAGIW